MGGSRAWLEYRRLFNEMEHKREAGKLTGGDVYEYMRTLGGLYLKLTSSEYKKAADMAVYFYERQPSSTKLTEE